MFNDLDLRDARLSIEKHVTRQEGVLRANHLRTTHVTHRRQLNEWDLLASGGRDNDPLQCLQAVSLFAHVTDPHRIAFAALDGAREGHASESHLKHILNVDDGQPVAAYRFPIQLHLEVGFTHYPVSEDSITAYARHGLQDGFQFEPECFDGFQSRPVHFDSHGSAHPALQH